MTAAAAAVGFGFGEVDFMRSRRDGVPGLRGDASGRGDAATIRSNRLAPLLVALPT